MWKSIDLIFKTFEKLFFAWHNPFNRPSWVLTKRLAGTLQTLGRHSVWLQERLYWKLFFFLKCVFSTWSDFFGRFMQVYFDLSLILGHTLLSHSSVCNATDCYWSASHSLTIIWDTHDEERKKSSGQTTCSFSAVLLKNRSHGQNLSSTPGQADVFAHCTNRCTIYAESSSIESNTCSAAYTGVAW